MAIWWVRQSTGGDRRNYDWSLAGYNSRLSDGRDDWRIDRCSNRSSDGIVIVIVATGLVVGKSIIYAMVLTTLVPCCAS